MWLHDRANIMIICYPSRALKMGLAGRILRACRIRRQCIQPLTKSAQDTSPAWQIVSGKQLPARRQHYVRAGVSGSDYPCPNLNQHAGRGISFFRSLGPTPPKALHTHDSRLY
jgi:hypothetical protein